MRASSILLVNLLGAALPIISLTQISVDHATYIYDDLSRLSQVIGGKGSVET